MDDRSKGFLRLLAELLDNVEELSDLTADILTGDGPPGLGEAIDDVVNAAEAIKSRITRVALT